MKRVISTLLYIIVFMAWLAIQDYEQFFIWAAWFVAFIQDLYDPKTYEYLNKK